MRNLLGDARALFVAPEITSGGFLVGMQEDQGMLFQRHGKEWSDPVKNNDRLECSLLAMGGETGNLFLADRGRHHLW